MRRLALLGFLVGSVGLLACSQDADVGADDATARAQSSIVYGTTDTTHTAVVALLNADGTNSYDVCSGTIVQVNGTLATVLTAAHCCNSTQPQVVVMANDYANYVNDIGSNSIKSPAYPVVAASVTWDTAYNQTAHDFCMLQFSGASSSTPVIPVALPGQDGLASGSKVEHVGFGDTQQTNSQNSVRMHATDTVDQGVTTDTIKYSEGANSVGGPCEGDSGGPALMPAGSAQSAQKVVATTSYGDQSCTSYGVSMRVSSESGPTGFIGKYLAAAAQGAVTNGNGGGASGTTTSGSGTTSSSSSGGASSSCDTCQSTATSQGGACYSAVGACENNSACLTLLQCLNACTTSTCENTCVTQSTTAAQSLLEAAENCICTTGCATECASECGTTSTSTGTGNTTSTTAAGGGSGTTGATTGSGSNSNGTTASTTGGNGGATGATTGGGAGGGDSGTVDLAGPPSKTGCSVGDVGGDEGRSTETSLAGLALGAALVLARRRRAV